MIDLIKIKKKYKSGFTLIELAVVLGLLLIFSIMVIFTMNNMYRLRSYYEQEMIIQQNFRIAIDKITEELRQANKEEKGKYDIVLIPNDINLYGNAMDEELIFTRYINNKLYCVRYRLLSDNNGNAVYRSQYEIVDTQILLNPLDLKDMLPRTLDIENETPITENMKQLVKLYFIRQGGKVIVCFVGKIDYYGKSYSFSYASMVFSRNSNKRGYIINSGGD